MNPAIFPVNSLEVYLFLDTHNLMGDKKLFPGK